MTRRAAGPLAALAWSLGGCAAPAEEASEVDASAATEAETEAEAFHRRLRPLPPDAVFGGKDLAAWMVEYNRWSYRQNTCVNPADDLDGSQCGLYQDPASPVFFLASGLPEGVTRSKCVVPRGKAIMVPLVQFSIDNGGVPEDQVMTEEEMIDLATSVRDDQRDLAITVDGVAVEKPEAYILGPARFDYTLPPPPNWYTCYGLPHVPGTIAPAFASGSFVLLAPPSRGRHRVTYQGTTSMATASANVTFTVGR